MKHRRFVSLATIGALSLMVCPAARPSPDPDRTNVCDYGAIPNDGLTDVVAIQAAINAPTPTPPPGTGAAPKSIYFPPGTYNVLGQLTLLPNTSYRLYGDGPGVTTITFTHKAGGTCGFLASDMGQSTLNVEGLTLKAGATGSGAAINASFSNSSLHSVTIHNVQIVGSTTDGLTGGYWNEGIHLTNAQHAFLDKIRIAGNKNATQYGIVFESSPAGSATIGAELSNLAIKWCNTALKTSFGSAVSNIAGLHLCGFEFLSCGRSGQPAVDLTSTSGEHTIANGRIESPGDGMLISNGVSATCGINCGPYSNFNKVSDVYFRHYDPDESASTGNMLNLNHVVGSTVVDCSFWGYNAGGVTEYGIILQDANQTHVLGNNFTNIPTGTNGACFWVDPAIPISTTIRMFDNLWNGRIYHLPLGSVTRYGNYPTP